MRRLHHHERTGGGIKDEVAGFGDGGDQSQDQRDRLDVRMNATIDLFRPSNQRPQRPNLPILLSVNGLDGGASKNTASPYVPAAPRSVSVGDSEVSVRPAHNLPFQNGCARSAGNPVIGSGSRL